MAGGELPQVRQRELRNRQDLRLHRQHRDEHQADPQPRPRPGERRRPRRGEDPRRRRARAGRLLADPAITPAAKNARIPALQKKITRARTTLAAATAARKPIPAKLPASTIDPDAKTALLRAGAAACRWSCGCSPATPSTGYRATSTPTSATTTSTAPSPARPSSAAWPAPSPARPPRSPSPSSHPAPPRRPRPGPAHRGDQRHPARHARRQPPHHLPPRPPARHLTPNAHPLPEICAGYHERHDQPVPAALAGAGRKTKITMPGSVKARDRRVPRRKCAGHEKGRHDQTPI